MLLADPAFVELSADQRTLWCVTNRVLAGTGGAAVPLESGGLLATPVRYNEFLAGVDAVATLIRDQLLDAFAPLALARHPMWQTFTQFTEQRALYAAAQAAWTAAGIVPVWPAHLSVLFAIVADMLDLPPLVDATCPPYTAAIADFWPPVEGKPAWRKTHLKPPAPPAAPFFKTMLGKGLAVVGVVGVLGAVLWAGARRGQNVYTR